MCLRMGWMEGGMCCSRLRCLTSEVWLKVLLFTEDMETAFLLGTFSG